MSRIHVCLVSAQPIPNLIPLKITALAPERVILLVSPDMKVQAGRLVRVIGDWKIAVEKVPVKPFDLESMGATCATLLHKYRGDEITLNVTGGTKLMALAAFETFRAQGKPILYVDTQHHAIRTLSPEQETRAFESVLGVEPYLAAYGQHVVGSARATPGVTGHQLSIKQLVDGVTTFELALGALNRHVAPLRGVTSFPLEKEIPQEDFARPNFEKLLSLFVSGGVLRLKNRRLTFQNRAAVEFISGGWLEEYVFGVVSGLSPTDVRMGVNVEWDQRGRRPTTNEYDVIFTAHNQLYMIECKTKRFEGKDKEESAADPIYKLDCLKDAGGGLFGRGMLVSDKRLTDEQKDRLKANKLEYCDGPGIRELARKIEAWTR